MDVPGYLEALSLAEARTDAGQWAQAIPLWQEVTEQNPVNGNHFDRLAQAQYESGDYAAALTAWKRAAELGVWDRQTLRRRRSRPAWPAGTRPWTRSPPTGITSPASSGLRGTARRWLRPRPGAGPPAAGARPSGYPAER